MYIEIRWLSKCLHKTNYECCRHIWICKTTNVGLRTSWPYFVIVKSFRIIGKSQNLPGKADLARQGCKIKKCPPDKRSGKSPLTRGTRDKKSRPSTMDKTFCFLWPSVEKITPLPDQCQKLLTPLTRGKKPRLSCAARVKKPGPLIIGLKRILGFPLYSTGIL